MDILSNGTSETELSTHISTQVLENIGLEWHVHIDRAQYPAELRLDDVEYSWDVDGVSCAVW